jgi:hypothetical protein
MCPRASSMDQIPDEVAGRHIHAVMEAVCHALISLERISAALPNLHRRPDLQSEIDQASESLREAIREVRLAGAAKPTIQELDFVIPEAAPSASGQRQARPLRTA